MFKSLFTPKWQHQDATIRKEALKPLTFQADPETLAQMACEDSDASIRRLALEKFEQVKPLQNILAQAKSSNIWCEIASRILDIQPDNKEALSVQFKSKNKDWQDDVTQVIKQCPNSQLAEQILLQSDDPNAQFETALSAKSIGLRLAAVEKINTMELLHSLVKQAKHKQVVQLARKRLNQFKEEQQLAESQQKEALKICEVLEEMGNKGKQFLSPNEYVAKLSLQESHWRKLTASLITPFSARYEKALANCLEIKNSMEQALKQAALESEAENSQEMVCEQLVLIKEELSTSTLDSTQSQIEALFLLTKTWQQSLEIAQPNARLKGQHSALMEDIQITLEAWRRFESLNAQVAMLISEPPSADKESLETWITKWDEQLKQLDWPKNKSMPNQFLEWNQDAENLRKKLASLFQKLEKSCQQLFYKIGSLQKHIRQKNLIAANKQLNYIQFEIDKLDEESQKKVNHRLESVLPSLTELRDWHAFATKPKKEALCNEMSALASQQLAPLDLAEKIHQLQESWHELVSSDSDADQVLWDKFKAAADTAYQPCLAYYAEQDKVRSENLNAKISICNDIEQFVAAVDWENEKANKDFWRKLDQRYSQITKDWKQFEPVPLNEQKRVQRRFGKSIDQIKGHLKEYKQDNLDARESLIKKAEKLINADDLKSAIDTAKSLQQEWTLLGITFYKADKQSWQAFRSAIDAIFERRKTENQAFKQSLDQNLQLLKTVTDSINQLAALDDIKLKQSSSEYDSLVDQWNSDKELPRKYAKDCLNAYKNACEKYRTQFSGISQRETINKFEALKTFVSSIEKLESDYLQGNSSENKGLLDKASDVALTEKMEKILTRRISAILKDEISEESLESKERLESLVLNAEISLDIESPQEFKSQRMAFQLEQLEKGVGQQQKISKNWLTEFYEDWLAESPLSMETRQPLSERFNRVVEKVLG